MKHHAFLVFLFLSVIFARGDGLNVRDLALTGDGHTDDTAALQKALDADSTDLYFPAGSYFLGTVKLPKSSRLTFDPNAFVKVNNEKLAEIEGIQYGPKPVKVNPVFVAVGDRVRVEGLQFDFAGSRADVLVYARGLTDIRVSGVQVQNSTPRELIPVQERKRLGRFKTRPSGVVLYAEDCRNVVLENSGAVNIENMIQAEGCANVDSKGNWMTSGCTITTFSFGGENLRHHDNWSRDVEYQVVWLGGSPDPSRKAPQVPLGSAMVAKRGSRPDTPDWNPNTAGSFDVLVQNNYAEYGNTLAWGNKGRQVVIDSNIARFISDYAYGTEGGENVIFSNNISINSTSGGIVSMYWGEKLLVTGNMLITRHEPWSEEWTWWDRADKYLGSFIRLHHGPPNPEDKYGAGSVQITGNLCVSELSARAVDCQIEGGRDVLINGNKFINGGIHKYDEILEGKRRVSDAGRVTVMSNEFVNRLGFDVACVALEGSTGVGIVKDNVFRKEMPTGKATEEEKLSEEVTVPYLLFTDKDEKKATGQASRRLPVAAIAVSPMIANFTTVQGNFIYGWKEAVNAENASPWAKAVFVIQRNTSDGTIGVNGPADRTRRDVKDNVALPAGLMPQ